MVGSCFSPHYTYSSGTEGGEGPNTSSRLAIGSFRGALRRFAAVKRSARAEPADRTAVEEESKDTHRRRREKNKNKREHHCRITVIAKVSVSVWEAFKMTRSRKHWAHLHLTGFCCRNNINTQRIQRSGLLKTTLQLWYVKVPSFLYFFFKSFVLTEAPLTVFRLHCFVFVCFWVCLFFCFVFLPKVLFQTC